MTDLLEEFEPEITTCWSFPQRGDWATHNPKYRGNFAPQIPRNVILSYSKEGDLVLDPMVGSGTTLIECKLLHRNAIGIDINPSAVKLTKEALNFEYEQRTNQRVYLGDVRSLEGIPDNSIGLICTHPPYMNIISYSDGVIEADLSRITSPQKFCDLFEAGIQEMYRVLKPDHYCAILIGDTRRAQHYVPLSSFVMQKFLQNGFILKEDIIKAQHNVSLSRKWISSARKYGFYLIMHEHLFIFRKPRSDEDLSRVRWSRVPKGRKHVIE